LSSSVSNQLERPYKFSLTLRGSSVETDIAKKEELDVLYSIRDTLRALTGTCQVCQYSEDLICRKLGKNLGEGDACEYFVRRVPRAPTENPAKAHVQNYVDEVLGIKGKNAKRLTDHVSNW
jgi:hypothetical protein